MTIKIYTTHTCPWCDVAKDFLRSKDVPFIEIDVQTNRAAAQEMITKSGQMGVPVIDINGSVIVGFNKNAIEMALSFTKQF